MFVLGKVELKLISFCNNKKETMLLSEKHMIRQNICETLLTGLKKGCHRGLFLNS